MLSEQENICYEFVNNLGCVVGIIGLKNKLLVFVETGKLFWKWESFLAVHNYVNIR